MTSSFLWYPISNPSANSGDSAFKIYPESSNFSPYPLPPGCSKLLPSSLKLLQNTHNWYPCCHKKTTEWSSVDVIFFLTTYRAWPMGGGGPFLCSKHCSDLTGKGKDLCICLQGHVGSRLPPLPLWHHLLYALLSQYLQPHAQLRVLGKHHPALSSEPLPLLRTLGFYLTLLPLPFPLPKWPYPKYSHGSFLPLHWVFSQILFSLAGSLYSLSNDNCSPTFFPALFSLQLPTILPTLFFFLLIFLSFSLECKTYKGRDQ